MRNALEILHKAAARHRWQTHLFWRSTMLNHASCRRSSSAPFIRDYLALARPVTIEEGSGVGSGYAPIAKWGLAERRGWGGAGRRGTAMHDLSARSSILLINRRYWFYRWSSNWRINWQSISSAASLLTIPATWHATISLIRSSIIYSSILLNRQI